MLFGWKLIQGFISCRSWTWGKPYSPKGRKLRRKAESEDGVLSRGSEPPRY